MKEAIRHRARELGFDDCRVTTAAPPESAARFQEWLARGQHGEMAYLERNAARRIKPEQVLSGARSVITLAVSYAEQDRESKAITHDANVPPHSDNGGSRSAHSSGLIARYARFEDYHEVLGARLESLTRLVNQLGGEARVRSGMWIPGRCSSATSPNAQAWASSANTPT